MPKKSVKTPVDLANSAGVTILDLARELGISHTTVSRALADHPHISAETKRRVNLVAGRMGYVPNASARTMRGGRSTIVGLVIPDVKNDFYAAIAKIVADALASRAMQLILSVTEDDPERELRELNALREMRPAGVIVVATSRPHAETLSILRSIPSVQLMRFQPDLDLNAVLVDEESGTLAAARHLLDQGHRKIAYIGGQTELSTGRERLRGFERALKERKLAPADILLGPPRPEFARRAVTSMMTRRGRPTALVLGSAELALGALQGLRALGMEWPRDVSIVGYHDPAWFELVGAGVTTVRLPVEDIALMATNVVLSRSENSEGSKQAGHMPEQVRFAPTLILRGSTASMRPGTRANSPARGGKT
jgi:LacI family transcriptional regulator